MNKQVNQDLKNLTNWLNTNRICLNVSKTEVVLFESPRKLSDVPLKLKLNEKQLYPSNSVKYLGIIIDDKFMETADFWYSYLVKQSKWYLI